MHPPLVFDTDLFQSLESKDVQPSLFVDKVLKALSLEDGLEDLELCRSLDLQRRELVCRQSPMKESLQFGQLQQLASYIEKLHLLSGKPNVDERVEVSWTSPLAGYPSSFYRLKGLICELSMATALLASALQTLAQRQLPQGLSSAAEMSTEARPDEQTASHNEQAACAAASMHFRQAAGVYEWLAEWAIPQCMTRQPSSRPAELSLEMARVMAMVCNGQAQVVIGLRAEQRKSPPSLLASLFVGASELFEAGAKKLKEKAGEIGSISERLRRCIAISAGMCHARALIWWAEHHKSELTQAGKAEAACIQAALLLKQCEAAAQGYEWQDRVKREQCSVEECRVKCEHDRVGVFYQTVAKAVPDLPASKVLAKGIQWAPGQALSIPN